MAGIQSLPFGPSRILTETLLMRTGRRSIARLIAPILPVTERSAKILRFDQVAESLKPRDTRRAMGANTQRGTFDIGAGQTYTCIDHDWELPLPRELSASEVKALASVETYVMMLREILTVSEDVDMVTKIVANLTGTLTVAASAIVGGGGTYWDSESGTPITDLNALIAEITITSGGVRPTSMLMNDADARKCFLTATEFTSLFKFTEAPTRSALEQMLANATGLKNVYLIEACVKNTSLTDTPTIEDVFKDKCLIWHAEPAVGTGLVTSNPFCTPVWTAGDQALAKTGSGGFKDGWLVDIRQDENAKCQIVRASSYYDQMVTYPAGDPMLPARLVTAIRTPA